MRQILLLSLLSLISLSACHKRDHTTDHPEDSARLDVQVSEVVKQSVPTFEHVVGTVKPRLEATVAADISGRILEFYVVSGQHVKRGDMIAKLDAQELEASLVRAEASYQQMKHELARQKKLIKNNATSRSRLEQVVAAEQMAQASVDKIKATLDKAIIRAPFSGTITRKFTDTGDLAIVGRPLIQIEDPSALRLEMPVAESLAGTLTLGQAMNVEIEAANLCVSGTVGELEPSADSASRTFLVKVDLPPTPSIRAGLFGRAWVPRGQSKKLLVPASAVVKRGQMKVVFIADHGEAKLRLVRTVPHSEALSVVLSGLSEHDRVILSPPASLRDEALIKTNLLP